MTSNFFIYLLFQHNGLDVDSMLEIQSAKNQIQYAQTYMLDIICPLNVKGRH